MDKKNFEKDINVSSKRLDRVDKMEIKLANYEQMERDIEKIIEPYQFDWDLDWLSLPNAIQSILRHKEQELQEAMDNYVKLDNQRVKEYNELVDRYTAKEQECEALQMSENEAGEIIAELKAENDTLRQFLSKEPLALQALQSAYSSYKKSTDVFYEMVKQYKQTLAHIKEILLINKRELEECLHNDIDGQIIKIISECEVLNE